MGDRKQDEKGHKLDLNPGPPQWGQSLCTCVTCSANWATGAPHANYFLQEQNQFLGFSFSRLYETSWQPVGQV